jgi:iron complex transport system substrate-binding protein
MHPDEITGAAIEIAIAIHRELGPGLLESVYEAILAYELRKHGFGVRRQQHVRFRYDGMVFDEAFRADLIVEDTVVIDGKALTRLDPVCARQLLTYLRLLDLPVGLVINFGQPTLLAGVKRIVNNLPTFSHSRVRINRRLPG